MNADQPVIRHAKCTPFGSFFLPFSANIYLCHSIIPFAVYLNPTTRIGVVFFCIPRQSVQSNSLKIKRVVNAVASHQRFTRNAWSISVKRNENGIGLSWVVCGWFIYRFSPHTQLNWLCFAFGVDKTKQKKNLIKFNQQIASTVHCVPHHTPPPPHRQHHSQSMQKKNN